MLNVSQRRVNKNSLTWWYVLKTSWRYLCKTSWRCIEDVFKTSWRLLEDILKTFFKTSWRRFEDVLARHLEDVLKTSWRCLKMSWRRRLKRMFSGYFTISQEVKVTKQWHLVSWEAIPRPFYRKSKLCISLYQGSSM